MQSSSRNQKANLRALCCTERRSTPLWQQKQYLTCTYLVASSAQWLLRLNPRLMGIWVRPGMLLCSVQRLEEVRNHKKCYGISGVMCNTYRKHSTYLSWKSLIYSDILSLCVTICNRRTLYNLTHCHFLSLSVIEQLYIIWHIVTFCHYL
jgi:hypothetical protein